MAGPTPSALLLRPWTVLMLLITASGSPGDAAQPVPRIAHAVPLQFTGFVVDQADILPPAAEAKLTARLDRLQRRTGHQFAVVTVASLGGQDVGRFTTALANRWGVGRKGLNDGIVLLVAPNERKVRIAIGFGLERTMPDAICAAIIQRDILPAFRKGEMIAGIDAGVTAIIDRLERTAAGAGSGNRTRVTSLEV